MDNMDDMNDVDHFEVLMLAMLNALNDEGNYLVPVESRNLDSRHARIAYNVILRSKSITPKSNDPDAYLGSMDQFFLVLIHLPTTIAGSWLSLVICSTA
jgi:hypothetical protein